jgi:Type II CAAX prenyl endopeptidase Rce1-like
LSRKAPLAKVADVKTIISALLTVSLLFSNTAFAQVPDFSANDGKFFSPALNRRPTDARAYFGPQLVSVLLPGFDQWYEGQYRAAAVYSALYIGGTALSAPDIRLNTEDEDAADDDEEETTDLDDRGSFNRQRILGSQIAFDVGLLSAYHSFRTAVRSQQANGKFLFLKKEETTDQILSAPLAFSEITKPTTYIPLVLLLGLGIADLKSSGGGKANWVAADSFYTAAYSYGAGTSEEAAFRGWLMPVAQHWFENEFWSNTSTALVFAAAHISGDNPVPVPQFLLGWYLGYLTQRNDWTLRQSIFIHTWWDIIAFGLTYYDNSRPGRVPGREMVAPLLKATF